MPTSTSPGSPAAPAGLPLVVQVGFAGARKLFDAKVNPDIDAVAFEAAVQEKFEKLLHVELGKLNVELPLFWCGVSPVAIGGDTIFTRACKAHGISQRVFLPQPRHEFLNAGDEDGPDFTPEQKATALALLESPHVIQERVVSDASDRNDRFRDVNLEMIRVCDVLVCLLRADQVGKATFSSEVKQLAAKRDRPVLEIVISVQGTDPVLKHEWHDHDKLHKPTLPGDIDKLTLPPNIDEYTRGLIDHFGSDANRHRDDFRKVALLIIGTHIFATVFAVLALRLWSDHPEPLLAVELLLLAIGFGVHQYLHPMHWILRLLPRRHDIEHMNWIQQWAFSRLTAETARSVSTIGAFHIDLKYLFNLPFPTGLSPLLNTLNVLHLRSTVAFKAEPWQPNGQSKRDAYVRERLDAGGMEGQIPYNQVTRKSASSRLKLARSLFLGASLLAFAATFIKLLVVCDVFTISTEAHDILKAFMGFLAIVLPVIAVAAQSLASAFDLEARQANSKEMIAFLNEQKKHLENATSTREYARLLIETESRLLGETVNWYARRSFLGVA